MSRLKTQEAAMRAKTLVLAVAAFWVLASSSTAAENTAAGRIVRFECGDSCYLVVKTKAGKELTGLCVAKTCQPWNEMAEMPSKYVGRRVSVKLGTGTQVDGNGDVVGEFPSFTEIRFLKKK
jgi:hypothetical protein